MDASTDERPDALAVAQRYQDSLIARRLPAWMSKVDPSNFGLLAQALQSGLLCRQRLAGIWARVEPVDRFARARLQQAVEARYAIKVDVERLYFRQWYYFTSPSSSYITSRVPTQDSDYYDTTLLSAALINFTAEQTQSEGQSRRNRLVDAAEQPLQQPTAHAFASFCRELDLGGQYQQHLTAVLDGPQGPTADAKTFRQRLSELYASTLLVDAFKARAQGQLDNAELALVIDLYRTGTVGRLAGIPVVAKQLQAFGCDLQQILVLDVLDEGIIRTTSRRVLVYIPGDPQGAWNVADDLEAFARRGLGKRLRSSEYRRFFSRFVRQRDSAAFFSAVSDRLDDVADWATRDLDQHMKAYPLPLFEHLAAQRVAQIMDDAALIATPTAEIDQEVRRAHEKHLQGLGWTLAGLAAFFVPAIGAMMLAVMAWELLDEVFQSVQDWREGDTGAALDHLLNVAKDVAVIGATAAGIKVAQSVWQRCAMVDRMVPAVLGDGSSKLWNQDLAPYSVVPPPLEATLDAQGIHQLGEQRWIEMDGCYLRVYQEQEDAWYLEAYDNHAPLLEHNGAGAWRLWSERPAEWRGTARMFRRLGTVFAELDDAQIADVMTAHGLEDDHLRGLHVYGRPPEAELIDTVLRVRLANRLGDLANQLQAGSQIREPALLEKVRDLLAGTMGASEDLAEVVWRRRRDLLQALYDEQNVVEGEVAVLCRDFTSLHRLSAQQLLSESSEAENQALLDTGRVPLSLARRARARVLRIQAARLAEGLFIDTPQTFVFAREVLKLLDTLPGSAFGRRWVLRDDDGLMPIYRSATEGEERLLVHQEGVFTLYDQQGMEPAAPGELFEVLAEAFEPSQRVVMGIGEPFAIQARRVLLRLQASRRSAPVQSTVTPGLRLPVRLADGRVGYPMAGGQQHFAYNSPTSAIARLRHLYPDLSSARLRQWLAIPAVAQDTDKALNELEAQFESMRQVLRLWRRNGIATLEWHARGEMKRALVDCWRFTLPPLEALSEDIMFSQVDLGIRTLPHFPPTVRFPHIKALVLRGLKTRKIPDEFMQAFPNLHTLEITHCRLDQLPLPARLRGQIRFLDLSDNQLVFHQAQGAIIGECTELRYLNLSRNPLGRSFSVRTLPQLNTLLLAETRLTNLPIGALDSLQLNHLDMSENRLSRLPDNLLGSRLWREQRVRLVNCNVTLPVEPIRSWYEPENSEIPDRLRWQDYMPPEKRKALATYWRDVETRPGSERFFRLLRRLMSSADFGYDTTARFLAQRLLAMLEVMDEEGNEALRKELFAASDYERCSDNATLCFGNLEVRVRVWEAQQRELAYDTESALLRLGGQLWRLEALDAFARQHAVGLPNRGAEEVEVVLAYRQALVHDLDLPLNPSMMLYESIADVTASDIAAARTHVRDAQQASVLALSLLERDFWVKHLQEMHPSRLKVPKRFRSQVEALSPGPGYEQASRNIQEQVDAWLLGERLSLTLESLKYGTWRWKVQVKW
ncbi:NEL-type E3 ubiquitin ligase domain-containing protein [Pantoea sp. Cy-639]|uniref:NEL-type E3 ubiquitin ligase domain-containing protein n=1 Tax=Pantoea sp. Cy-639 TaxID=2608360 RepID=UPI00141F1BAA|nr:NEL-type E3 ubiquitin ligase domain-containing protein [Pantoea sp. Cy-639]NIF18774.1 hypothetical protein [Pantoea sp. Cy-639]